MGDVGQPQQMRRGLLVQLARDVLQHRPHRLDREPVLERVLGGVARLRSSSSSSAARAAAAHRAGEHQRLDVAAESTYEQLGRRTDEPVAEIGEARREARGQPRCDDARVEVVVAHARPAHARARPCRACRPAAT